jgi:hypothetical protein
MKTLKRHLQSEWPLAFLFVSGLLLVGSDGNWFPIPNFVGISLMSLFSSKVLRAVRSDDHRTAQETASPILRGQEIQDEAFSGI